MKLRLRWREITPSSPQGHEPPLQESKANKARLGNPYQPAVSSEFFRSSNLNHRFDARPRWQSCQRLNVRLNNQRLVAISTKALTDAVAAELDWLSDSGFRYLRSVHQFRRDDSHGYSYITLNSVTHNRVDYHVAFYLGVRCDVLETLIRQIRGDSSDLTHDDRSILHYSVNTGPTNHGWRQPLIGTWTLRDSSELTSIAETIQAYMRHVALPFLEHNKTPEDIRSYLMDFPGHTQNQFPWRQILGADVLAGDQVRLEADFEALSTRYAKFVSHLRSDFETFYHAARNHI